MNTRFDDWLAHYGVKGMKWGVRKEPERSSSASASSGSSGGSSGSGSSGGSSGSGSAHTRYGIRRTGEELGNMTRSGREIVSVIADRKRKNTKDSGKASKMSDDELRRVVNRLNMEKQYNDLTKKDTASGLSKLMDILAVSGSVLSIVVAGANLYSSLKYGENQAGVKNKKK